ncbi:uncharacterized protein LOC135840243 [Planococcus citri]|uniref:uncharacterized protein LOC135840243 n=1 Tax=Planococcus citri TaxID=170843 RepID=UPI0031FA0C07
MILRTVKSIWRKHDFLIICSFIVFGLTVYHRLDNINFYGLPKHIPCDSTPYVNNPKRFEGIVNRQANVPRIVHLLRFGQDVNCFTQGDLDAIVTILGNFEPEQIYVHTDDVKTMKNIINTIFVKEDVRNIIDVKFYPRPKHVFGLNISETFRHKHMIDFTKIKILRRYGGIFLNNDIHIVQDPSKFLQFEMTVVVRSTSDVDSPLELFDEVIIAHRDARFLEQWLKSYHLYDQNAESHVKRDVMKNLLKKNTMYVHILDNDISKQVVANSEEYHAMLSSRKRHFINIQSTDDSCLV